MSRTASPPSASGEERRLARALADWFAVHGRDLPWRAAYDPYQILVSEIMAQQTQMSRVTAYFERWVDRWPDAAVLARADEEEALRLWEGLGYYSRCRNLLKAARMVVEDFQGRVPDSPADLLRLPGVGRYTAGAVASIAYNKPHPAVDANVERVLARVYDLDKPVKEAANQGFIEDRAAALIPEGRARDFNQGLMELGALVCTPRRPACPVCPVSVHCRARILGLEEERPVPGKKADTVYVTVATGVLVHQGRVYIQKRKLDDVWPGLWEFPGGVIEPGEEPAQAVVREFDEETGLAVVPVEPLGVVKYSYTRFRVTLHGFSLRYENGFREPETREALEGRFATLEELADLAFPAGHRRLIDILRGHAGFLALLKAS